MSPSFENITAGRDFVGNDKIDNHILPKPTQIDKLNELYKQEIIDDNKITTVIDELHHYNSNTKCKKDLSTILCEAGFEYIIDEAIELKELISKMIIKHQNYRSAQKIITYILSEVESIFISKIKPKLPTIKDEIRLKKILRIYLENEIKDQLGENVLEIYNRQINGMMYFLTGNCHIQWKNDAVV